MKRIAFIALLSVLCLTAFAKGKQPIPYKSLPKEVQKEVKKSYTQQEVQLITSEKKAFKHHEYTLIMEDGSKVAFNEKGQVTNARNAQGIKDAFIPKTIAQYIKKTTPNAVVTEYRMDSNKQEIILNDQMTFVFDKKGKFLRLD